MAADRHSTQCERHVVPLWRRDPTFKRRMECPRGCASYAVVHPFHRREICSECDADMVEVGSDGLLRLALRSVVIGSVVMILTLAFLLALKEIL